MILGTTVKISSTTDVDGSGADSATITIVDPDGTTEVDGEAMTDAGSGVFTYLYQSAVSDVAGTYTATITAVSSTYNAVSKVTFVLSP